VNWKSLQIFILCLGIMSCQSLDLKETYPGIIDDPKEVTLNELNRYYTENTNGLINYNLQHSNDSLSSIIFVQDPYHKRRILPTTNIRLEDYQGLFVLDSEQFVKQSGSEDFLGAVYSFYNQRSFDQQNEIYDRPYRYLSCWGNLFYPPIKKLDQKISFYHSQFSEDFDPKKVESIYFDPEFQKQLDLETQTDLTYGNELRALFNGEESYPEKLRLTSGAKSILYIAVMSIVADETGRELVKNIVNAKHAGVDVRLITEGFYTFSISNFCMGILEREGIPVVRVDDKSLEKLDRMFHNKIWIRDGEEAIMGGMNVLNYQNKSNGFNFLNRDTDILVQGPAVTDLLKSFIKLWKKYDKENRGIELGETILAKRIEEEQFDGVRGSDNYARWLRDPETRMKGICRTAVQGNNAEPQNIATLLIRYLESAENSFYMTSPEIEFDLDSNVPKRIDRLAGLMREKVRKKKFYLAYITNGTDGGLGETNAFMRSRIKDSQLMAETFWEDMLIPMIDNDNREVNKRVRQAISPLIEAGMNGFQYFNYIHAKVFYFDRLLVGIGSWNFDSFSADNNQESAIFCLDEKLRKQIEEHMVLDMINSVPIILQQSMH
jgi:phosphatidylserine/phosphatidylglycerophosphate/cardiolipin synthase-like enzyme